MTSLVPVALALFVVALVGALAPLSRGRRASLERLSDPLEDERQGLLRALRELEEDLAAGALREDDYRVLRAETETRAVAVLRALAARDGQERLREGWQDLREARRERPRGQPRRWVTALLVAASLVAASVPLLAGSLRSRDPGEAITGDLGPGASARQTDPLAFFEERVREYPRDVAARLDLAHRYLDALRVREAIDQYVEALRLDPENGEAHAHLGLLLFLAGRPNDALAEVERALTVDPRYPEALYIKGLVLLRGLGRESQAEAALRAYLEAAPFGGERDAVRKLLREIEDG